MKVVKSQGLLYIFYVLIKRGYIFKEEILNNIDIKSLSFSRYIQEIKAFIYNFHLPYELVYKRENKTYVLLYTNRE